MRATVVVPVVLALALVGLVAFYAARPDAPVAPSATLSLHQTLSADGAEGFARVVAPAALEFPRDHGPHPTHRIEWWYFTGNLEAEPGRRFGYQLTFFRRALSPVAEPSASAWSTNQMYMAHFAVTDVATGEHQGFEKLSRGAVGLAGAAGEPFRVWVDDWSAESEGATLFPMRLRASDGEIGIDLRLDAGKPVVRHGDDGFSVKTGDGSTASYYYSYTRVNTAGRVSVEGSAYQVVGSSWVDREWSTAVLDTRHTGWDWFSVQLDDGTELMCFRMRHADGPAASFVTGTYVAADGSARTLAADAVQLLPSDSAATKSDGAAYPSGWRLSVPDEGLFLDVSPVVRDQEMKLSFRYWEGAVRARGQRGAEPVAGYGYVELTGYEAATAAP